MPRGNKKTVSGTFPKSFAKFLRDYAKEQDKTEAQVIVDMMSDGYLYLAFEETEGETWIQPIQPWSPLGGLETVEEGHADTPGNIKEYKRLREEFGPIGSCIDYWRGFSTGGGFINIVDDPNDEHKKQTKIDVDGFGSNVYQDEIIAGLDRILDIVEDEELTTGVGAGEICYQEDMLFKDYMEEIPQYDPVTGQFIKNVYSPKGFTEEKGYDLNNYIDWKQHKGIQRIKIIDDAWNRVQAVRDQKSSRILYWLVDKGEQTEVKLLPQKIFWWADNTRGTALKGQSRIRKVASIAKLLEKIYEYVGEGFQKWGNPKWFFITGSEKKPWAAPHIVNFMNDLRKMIKENKSAIPVPAGFDLKKIGGEIFEGRDELDHFLTVICNGMMVPREFVESRSGATDKPFLAWTVMYGRHQQQFRRAIEHQLYRRHLYCLHGATYEVTKRGPEPEGGRERKPTYIPKLQWRAEGRWHKAERLKTLKTLLDPANPLDPPFKLRVEQDMAEILGYGAIDVSLYEDLFELQTKVKLINAERDLQKAEQLLKQEKEALARGELVVEAPIGEPETPEEKKKKEAEKRLEGGVHRTTRDAEKPTEKGKAKQLGGTRQPGT